MRAENDKVGAYMKAATIRDFEPGAVKDILERSDWAILSAENPGTFTLSPDHNAARTHALCTGLTLSGYRFTEVEGLYEGKRERSVLVLGISEQYALYLAASFSQSSILTRRGLVFTDGTCRPALAVEERTGLRGANESKILVTGARFEVQMDWNEMAVAA
jgi:hypothetical protein